MTPKQKADYLIEEYECVLNIPFPSAKMCALMSVDEVIEALNSIPDLKVEGNILLDKIEYYREVKKELSIL
jgi:hypothetical protein